MKNPRTEFLMICLLIFVFSFLAGCGSGEPVIAVLNPDNLSSGDVRVVGLNPNNPSDTLYNTIFPYGTHSCGILDHESVILHVIPLGTTGDTAVFSGTELMNRRSVRLHIRSGLKITVERTNEPSC